VFLKYNFIVGTRWFAEIDNVESVMMTLFIRETSEREAARAAIMEPKEAPAAPTYAGKDPV
jgi:hypothetical protein